MTVTEPAALIDAMGLVMRRELTLAWRRWDEVTQPLKSTSAAQSSVRMLMRGLGLGGG